MEILKNPRYKSYIPLLGRPYQHLQKASLHDLLQKGRGWLPG